MLGSQCCLQIFAPHLIFPAELRPVLKLLHLNAAVLCGVALGTGIGWVAVCWQDAALYMPSSS